MASFVPLRNLIARSLHKTKSKAISEGQASGNRRRSPRHSCSPHTAWSLVGSQPVTRYSSRAASLSACEGISLTFTPSKLFFLSSRVRGLGQGDEIIGQAKSHQHLSSSGANVVRDRDQSRVIHLAGSSQWRIRFKQDAMHFAILHQRWTHHPWMRFNLVHCGFDLRSL